MNPKRILIVDDEPRVALLMKQFLLGLGRGYTIETAASGQEALLKTQATIWDLVVTDQRMPGLSGLALIENIRQCAPTTLVILMTAFGTDEIEQAAHRLGVYQYLNKPFLMTDLKRVVMAALTSLPDALPVSASRDEI